MSLLLIPVFRFKCLKAVKLKPTWLMIINSGTDEESAPVWNSLLWDLVVLELLMKLPVSQHLPNPSFQVCWWMSLTIMELPSTHVQPEWESVPSAWLWLAQPSQACAKGKAKTGRKKQKCLRTMSSWTFWRWTLPRGTVQPDRMWIQKKPL